MKPKKSIIIAGSRGIGAGISKHLKTISKETIALSSKDFDTSKISDANQFVKKYYAKNNITTINIAPGPIDTDRIRNLNNDIQKLKDKLPLKRLGKTDEIGELVKNIVLKDIKYINGTTIFMDGGKSKTLF